MSAATTTPQFTLDDLLGIVFEGAGPTDLIRIVAESRRDFGDSSYFFSHRGGRWHWPPDAQRDADTPELVVARSATEVTWSPLLYQQSPMENAPAKLAAAYAVIPVKLNMSTARGLENYGAPDPASERAALARLGACSPQPSLILHAGQTITGFWLVKNPVPCALAPAEEGLRGRPREPREDERVYRTLWNLAVMLDGDRGAIAARTQTFAIPGCPMPGVFPRRHVSVEVLNIERRYELSEL